MKFTSIEWNATILNRFLQNQNNLNQKNPKICVKIWKKKFYKIGLLTKNILPVSLSPDSAILRSL